jgi:hypothetical protein
MKRHEAAVLLPILDSAAEETTQMKLTYLSISDRDERI